MRSGNTREYVQAAVAGLLALVLVLPRIARATDYPDFSQKYWETAEVKARAKILRGAVLGATGLAVAAPTAVLAIKAADDWERYLAWSAVVGIASLGMTLHGFFSIGFGARQKDAASRFVAQYKLDPAAVSESAEREHYLRTQKISVGKMVLFGLVLDVQAALLIANGVVLSVRDTRGELTEGVKIWPSYFVGGLLLLGGTAFAALKGRTFMQLVHLGRGKVETAEASFSPMLGVDWTNGTAWFGLRGIAAF